MFEVSRSSRVLLALTLLSTGCARKIAVNALADTLSGDTGGAFTRDEDLAFVGDAIPFALKTMETVAEQTPRHAPIRETLCSGFTQYALVYVDWPAQQRRYDDFAAYEAGQERAKRMLARARRYCFAAWELEHPGITAAFTSDPSGALARADEDDVSLLYWTAASWLSVISRSKEDPFAIGELPIAAALVQRALALDEDWDRGSLHDLMITLEPALPMPGGYDRAREHYERAIALAGGTRASPYLSLATSVAAPNQDRAAFEALLGEVLAIEASDHPSDQLANLYAQEQARFYLDHLDDLFLE